MISSGVTRRKAASRLRVSSFVPLNFGILVDVARVAVHRLEHRPRRGAQVRGVDHGESRRHHELLAHRIPERIACHCARRRQRPWRRCRELGMREQGGRAADGEQAREVPSGNRHDLSSLPPI
jgi:hypothetical protein